MINPVVKKVERNFQQHERNIHERTKLNEKFGWRMNWER